MFTHCSLDRMTAISANENHNLIEKCVISDSYQIEAQNELNANHYKRSA